MGKFDFKMKGGRPITGSQLRQKYERTGAVQSASALVVKAMKAETPVVTGRLRGGWAISPGSRGWQGSTLVENVVNPTPYARKVDRTSRRNAGYIARGIARAKAEAMERLKVQSASIVAELWAQK